MFSVEGLTKTSQVFICNQVEPPLFLYTQRSQCYHHAGKYFAHPRLSLNYKMPSWKCKYVIETDFTIPKLTFLHMNNL